MSAEPTAAAGRREPLLLIHGLGGSWPIWEPVIEVLEPEREVFALDMPGFGKEPPLPPGVEANAVNLAAALRERCLELGHELPHVAGNSLGGWVALEMGRAGWAASVTALSPAGLWRGPLGPGRGGELRRLARRLRPAISAALWTPFGRDKMLTSIAAHPERIPASARRQLVLGWIDAAGYDDANTAMRTNIFDPVGYPDIPVTLAWGELDRLVGPPRPERRPAGARFLVLPGVGHTPTWDDPELVARTLLDGSASDANVVLPG
jgi:pimeloyl-ACP methyl ester carboxylesterase